MLYEVITLIPQLDAELRTMHTVLLTGIPVLDKTDWRYYNSVVTLGGERRFYYKQHLVPFGEYLVITSYSIHYTKLYDASRCSLQA